MDISTEQVRLWIDQGIAIADRAVKALERRVEQNVGEPMLPGEYAAPDTKGLKTEDEVLQDQLSSLGKMLDPRSFAIEMGGEEGSVKMRATLSDEGRKQMGLKLKAAPAPSCDAPFCDCATGEDCKANGATDQSCDDCDCHSGAACETPEICAHEQNEAALRGAPAAAALRYATQKPRAIGDGPRRFIVTVDANEVSIDDMPINGDVDHDPLTDTIAEKILAALKTQCISLDGLTAKVDALAERKGGKGKDLTVRIVKVITAHKVSGRGLIWVVEHDDSIHPGTLVCSSNGSLGGRVMEVTGIETTSRPGQPMGLLVKPVKG